jgi:hypothetical protein
MAMFAVIMTSVVIFFVVFLLYKGVRQLYQNCRLKFSAFPLNKIIAGALMIFLIGSLLFLAIPILAEQENQYNQIRLTLNKYETLDADDLSLMNWIMQNTPSDTRILVSWGDGGQFLESITQRISISVNSHLSNYTDLMNLLTSNSSNLDAVPFLAEYNVSYVFIGSNPSSYGVQYPYYRHFNASQFLAVPYFTLIKEFGSAYLFEFNDSAALAKYHA